MSTAAAKTRRFEGDARSTLRGRLEARRAEIEQTALTRVKAIAGPGDAADPAYGEALRSAVAAALDYGLAAIERGDEQGPPMPVALLGQARLAARNGVSLDTVLRRYLAGYSLLGYFLIEEADREGLMRGAQLQRLLGTQAILFDQLLAAVGEEHTRESEALFVSSEQRQAERIERLLQGELVDTADIPYDFEGWHLGAIAYGPCAAESLRELARSLDLRPLLVRRGDERTVWGWLGARCRPDPTAALSLGAENLREGVLLALGEPGENLLGWRLTHRQAAAALPVVAKRVRDKPVRYADVALLASILQDDLLATSLRQLYLGPLQRERDRGKAAKETLRAYFAAGRNVSSTSAALGVRRHTVTDRLRAIEGTIGRPIDSCAAELDAALRLEELDHPNWSVVADPSVHIGRATPAAR